MTPAEVIDHAAEALRMAEKSDSYLRSLEGVRMSDAQAVVSQIAAVNGNLNALVHSQLAFVEQQRIANLLRVHVGLASNGDHDLASELWNTEIKEALGL